MIPSLSLEWDYFLNYRLRISHVTINNITAKWKNRVRKLRNRLPYVVKTTSEAYSDTATDPSDQTWKRKVVTALFPQIFSSRGGCFLFYFPQRQSQILWCKIKAPYIQNSLSSVLEEHRREWHRAHALKLCKGMNKTIKHKKKSRRKLKSRFLRCMLENLQFCDCSLGKIKH